MSEKKKVKRDEKGHAIVPGGKTFGNITKPKGTNSSRTNELIDRAANRIWLLLKKGAQADKVARKIEPIKNKQHINSLMFHNKLATSPRIVQFAFHRSKLETLKEELKNLLDSKNKRKIEFSAPAIQRDIETTEDVMREIFNEIKMESCIIKE